MHEMHSVYRDIICGVLIDVGVVKFIDISIFIARCFLFAHLKINQDAILKSLGEYKASMVVKKHLIALKLLELPLICA